jgi:hypothetical protein
VTRGVLPTKIAKTVLRFAVRSESEHGNRDLGEELSEEGAQSVEQVAYDGVGE